MSHVRIWYSEAICGSGDCTYGPEALEDVEVDIVLGDLLKDGGDGGG